nr:hypothetical protein [Tanacetum cinerariifolium]
MSSDSHATITYTSMSSYEVIVNGYYGMPMDPLDPYVQLVMEAPPSPTTYPGLSGGDDDADDDGDDLSEDDADDEEEEESSESEEEEDEHLAPTVP